MLNVTEKSGTMKAPPVYPCLRISSRKTVILFTAHGRGTVMIQGNSTIPVGEHGTTWSMEAFKHYYGAVEIENKVSS